MADARRYVLDIQQILLDAQHRWLRPAEICEILQNYKNFQIAPEPANMPPSGSLFLFDRKVLRYFRKDGHNWRKKKDGKTVKEAHERLKAGSVDVLHCYYAHGEHNENFQRRTYWMLEEELSHIVLVHYLEVKGNRMNIHRIKDTEEMISLSRETEASYEINSSLSSNSHQNNYQVPSQTMDSSSPQASEYGDAESAYSNQANSGIHSIVDFQEAGMQNIDTGHSHPYYPASNLTDDYQGNLSVNPGMDFLSFSPADTTRECDVAGLALEPQKHLDFPSWEQALESRSSGAQSNIIQPSVSSAQPVTPEIMPKHGHDILGQLFTDGISSKQEIGIRSQDQEELQVHITNKIAESVSTENGHYTNSFLDGNVALEGKAGCPSTGKQPFANILAEEGLKKIDSFNRWMSKQLGDVNELLGQSTTGAYWSAVVSDGVDSSDSQQHENDFMLTPSLSQEQLFSIVDFSPSWTYAGLEIKVLITGRFLRSQQEAELFKWSCMFGEVEVPAEVIADGVLCCHAPVHKAGRVPFYITCSNRVACSELREFEFRVNNSHGMISADTKDCSVNEGVDETLYMRFAKLLCANSPRLNNSNIGENSQLRSKICSLLKDDDAHGDHVLESSSDEFSSERVREQLFEKLLKEKLCEWLIEKSAEGGKGASVLDEGGQGVLHFASALGYDWALQPTIIAGVNVNFRDANGWTALHWAASLGREWTVASLISLGASPGALTDPTPTYTTGRTPADLASANGHKGIAGYLAESALSAHLSLLNLDTTGGDASHGSGGKAVQTISERSPTPIREGDLPSGLSLKDSLAAVCNASQAAARIHQVFRMQSFQRKQLKEYGDDRHGISDEHALSLVATKVYKPGQVDEPLHAAAIRIQNKFRGWKGRKDFLITRQRIVKIQAHFRGHQVRKSKNILWSVGIVEKVILRWRRKGSGLRGFKREALTEASSMQDAPSDEDEYDLLKEGRKQTEERLQKALARVKSMVQYPEARDQYSRLLNVVSEIQEAQVEHENTRNRNGEATDFYDDLIDLEELLDDDTLEPMAP
ncbi:calmodulin-binding transcription activator 3 isoform X3 [Rhodamnia argentea]|uniref:Calmodulin-binding transcription activator 3 isoform X3 n=1 Tax=Rhodamnia argentea TaxID=178133 RepID=A0A8B8NY59_9MYRT|nr:calmodulin-binding transcription activator 3 isoform X3 [Rhodamnia argentea]